MSDDQQQNEPLTPPQLLVEQMLGRTTQQFPQPKISEDDEGDLAFAIAADAEHNLVRIRFGHPVVWLGLPPDVAIQFAETILRKVKELQPGHDG